MTFPPKPTGEVLARFVAAGIVYLCRRRGGKVRARRNPGRASPMPLQRTSSYGLPGGSGGDPHVYQPVSMALTEDTFVPPSPAFSKARFGDSGLGAGERPKSVA